MGVVLHLLVCGFTDGFKKDSLIFLAVRVVYDQVVTTTTKQWWTKYTDQVLE